MFGIVVLFYTPYQWYWWPYWEPLAHELMVHYVCSPTRWHPEGEEENVLLPAARIQPMYKHKVMCELTITGSWLFVTQQDISFNVSFFTTLILAISGCFVTSSPIAPPTFMCRSCYQNSRGLPCIVTACEMFSLKHLYTLSISRYILPSYL